MPSHLSPQLSRAIALFTIAALLLTAPLAQADDRADFVAALNEGNKLADAGDHPGAIKQFEKALAASLRLYGKDDMHTGIVLYNGGNSYVALGQYANAEELYLNALRIYRKNVPAHDLRLRDVVKNAGQMYTNTGDYTKAERLLLESWRITQANVPADDPQIATTYNDLGALCIALGQFSKALEYHERALEIRQAKLPANHIQIGLSHGNLGLVYSEVDQFAKAEPHLLKCAAILESQPKIDYRELEICLANTAGLYRRMGKLDQTEKFARRALKIAEEHFGPEHPEVATSLEVLGHVMMLTGQFDKARPLYERSLAAREARLPPDHPGVATLSVTHLAMHDISQGKLEQAAERFERSRRSIRRHAAHVLPGLSEPDQLAFLARQDRPKLSLALMFALHAKGNAAIAERSAGWLANGKAVTQAALAERAQLGRDPRDAVARKLQTVRSELAALAMAAYQPGQEAERKQQLKQLSERERELATFVATARGQPVLDDPWVSIESIRKSLPAGGVLVDFARIMREEFTRPDPDKPGQIIKWKSLGYHYVAWIVPAAGKGDVQIVNLGPADKIEAAVAAYQKAIGAAQSGKALAELGEAEAEKQLAAPLAAVGKLVLDPLLPHLKNAEQLVLSPDGALWLTPWAALPAGEGKYAVERWQIRYVVAGREVALEQLRTSPVTPKAPRIFANPDYDLPQSAAQVAYNAVFNPGSVTPNSANPRTAQPALELLAMRSATKIGRVARLPGTAVEAASVAPNMQAYTGEEPKSYLDKSAQEAVFKRLSSPRVLLLSTHGFFLSDQHTKDDDDGPGEGVRRQGAAVDASGNLVENPLLRCGLLLAGCNERDKWNSGELGDGVLTGFEIVGVDLRGTELVVLSACETGLGQVNNGEGVAGLRQAFQIAGAKSVVSTLWQIPDKQSAQLMTDFFTNLAAGQSKAEALRTAQLAMIKARRDRNGAAHPIYWAAWTVTGN